MKNLLKNLGLILIAIGAVILIICAFSGDTNNNAILISALLMIIVGLIAHIVINKKITE